MKHSAQVHNISKWMRELLLFGTLACTERVLEILYVEEVRDICSFSVMLVKFHKKLVWKSFDCQKAGYFGCKRDT